MRVALYARYSDDRQSERSIEDQITVCTRHAHAQGWTVVAAFTDAAISGEAMVNRPGLLAAITAGERRDYDALLTEDEDRIARNLEHLAHVFNRLAYAGVHMTTLSTPKVELMQVAFKGLMGQDYLRNLRQNTSRGMRENAERGLATGSRLYGYRSAPGGAMEIVAEEAAVIRRIFERYVAGDSPRAIAAALNAEATPSPHGGQWNASSINGSRQRRNGILQSDLYAGVKVWNRWDMKKDPSTGKRVALIKPREDWRRTPVPHLRIVAEAAWDAAQARKARFEGAHPVSQRRDPRGLLSGLIKCGMCGSSYTIAHGGRMRCTARAERGATACWNRRTVMRTDVEQRVLETLRSRLLSPGAVRAYVRAYHRHWALRRAQAVQDRAPLDRRLAEVGRRIERAVDAILDGTAAPTIKARLTALEAEKLDLEARLAEISAHKAPIQLHPNAAEGYAAKVDQLQRLLTAGEPANTDLVLAIRDLIDRIVVTPEGAERASPVKIELYGRIARFLTPVSGPEDFESRSKVVAGGGISRRPTSEMLVRLRVA